MRKISHLLFLSTIFRCRDVLLKPTKNNSKTKSHCYAMAFCFAMAYVLVHYSALLMGILMTQNCCQSVVTKNCRICKKWLGIRLPSHSKTLRYYSHSLTSSFPQLLFALFWANFREFSLVLLRFSLYSLYSLCSQPVWYCFGINVWYQFSEKSAEKKIDYSFAVIDTWLCLTVQPALIFEYKE